MAHIRDGLRTMSVLVVFLLLTLCGGQVQHTGPSQSVMVTVSDDTVLPCQLEPPVDAVSMTMEWGRPDLDPRFVYVWHDGQELLVDQNQAYKGRASLSINKLKHGDLSLTLSKVKISDNGTYRCYIPKLNKEYFVELLVGAVSTPGISLAGINTVNSGVILDCESEGWYPEPEVSWLDGEGHVLSAGPTETVRGPDGLYTVSSRVTVEKRHRNNFTCRVQQKNINQTRETQIHVPEDFFMAPSSCTPSIVVSVLFGFMFILTVVLLVWTRRQNKTGREMYRENNTGKKEGEKKTTVCNDTTVVPLVEGEESRQQLMTKTKNTEDLEKTMRKLNEELQMKEEEQSYMTQVIETLTELTKRLEKQKEKITIQTKEAEKLVEENEKKVKSVEKEVTENGGDKTAKAQGYLKLKEILTGTTWELEDRRKGHQELHMDTDKLMKRTIDEVHKFKERKKKVENHVEQIKKQIKEAETEERK